MYGSLYSLVGITKFSVVVHVLIFDLTENQIYGVREAFRRDVRERIRREKKEEIPPTYMGSYIKYCLKITSLPVLKSKVEVK